MFHIENIRENKVRKLNAGVLELKMDDQAIIYHKNIRFCVTECDLCSPTGCTPLLKGVPVWQNKTTSRTTRFTAVPDSGSVNLQACGPLSKHTNKVKHGKL